MLPLRKSSEAPEVVPGSVDSNFLLNTRRASLSQVPEYEKPTGDKKRRPFFPPPIVRYGHTPPIQHSNYPYRKGNSHVLVTVLVAIAAFLVGGGVAGGIGGAYIVKDQSKIAR
jgi:hypothetical protein